VSTMANVTHRSRVSSAACIRHWTYPFFEDIISYSYPCPKKGYYILSLSRQKKDMDIYVKIFASIVTVSEQQKARPGSTAAHMSLTFYRIELKP
jgi:hypothetical protein